MKKILILGGTQFIGRCLVETLLEEGTYDITLFNRQKTSPGLFSSVNKIKGDRQTEDIEKISKTPWDVVVDLSCYYPTSLKSILQHIDPSTRYILISTCSVYNNEGDESPLKNESAPILNCSAGQINDPDPGSYGHRKAECERVLAASGIRHVILRPALVFGAHDYTDRFCYWLYQVRNFGKLMLPENGARLFSVTYVKDLVQCIIAGMKTESDSSIYNVISKPKASIGSIVKSAGEILGADFSVMNAGAEFLFDEKVTPWIDIPLWIHGDHFTYDNRLMIEELSVRPTGFDQAVKETIGYYDKLNWPVPEYGMTEERRKQLMTLLDN